MSRFDVILADPPWAFRTWSDKGKGRSAENHYKDNSVMPIADLVKLRLDSVAADNCVLFLWTTGPFLQKCFQVVEGWGFTYKTIAWVWVKTRKKSGIGLHMGLGYYTRSNAELCLLCTKGKPPRPADKSIINVILSPVRRHSQKPDEQYQIIERLYPNLTYLELFARQKQPGWATWGNEVENDICLTTNS